MPNERATANISSRRSVTLNRWLDILYHKKEIPAPPKTVWSPKFPNIKWPYMREEHNVDRLVWEKPNFPNHYHLGQSGRNLNFLTILYLTRSLAESMCRSGMKES